MIRESDHYYRIYTRNGFRVSFSHLSFVVSLRSAAEPTRLARAPAAGRTFKLIPTIAKPRNRRPTANDRLTTGQRPAQRLLNDLLLVVHNLVVRLDHIVGLGALRAAGRATRRWLLRGAVGRGAGRTSGALLLVK